MKKYKICVYAITKNEEKFVDQWVESMQEADMIVVTDTGSTDRTVEKLREKKVLVYEEKIQPWRFDVARNISLGYVPEDVDICVCTDLDELFVKGWRKKIEEVWQTDTVRGNYIYNWSLNEDGTPNVQFMYFKIHARNNFKWVCPVHEYLEYTGEKPEKKIFIPGVELNHYPDTEKSRSSYLPLLELAVKEDPLGARMNYYLGREYMYTKSWQKCIDTLKNYLELPTSVWNEERCAAMRWIAYSYRQLEQMDDACQWYYRAIGENLEGRDAYIEFAKMAYQQSDWETLYFVTEEALKINYKSVSFVNMGYSWDETPHDLAAMACYHLNMIDRAIEHTNQALAMAPNNNRLEKNLLFLQEKADIAKD